MQMRLQRDWKTLISHRNNRKVVFSRLFQQITLKLAMRRTMIMRCTWLFGKNRTLFFLIQWPNYLFYLYPLLWFPPTSLAFLFVRVSLQVKSFQVPLQSLKRPAHLLSRISQLNDAKTQGFILVHEKKYRPHDVKPQKTFQKYFFSFKIGKVALLFRSAKAVGYFLSHNAFTHFVVQRLRFVMGLQFSAPSLSLWDNFSLAAALFLTVLVPLSIACRGLLTSFLHRFGHETLKIVSHTPTFPPFS